MNCRPGDLAVIVRESQWSGWIVEVVSAISRGESFTAPDGTRFRGPKNSDWLIKARRPFGKLPFAGSHYGAAPDAALRPIRDPGEDARDETLSWLPVPIREIA